MKNALFRFSGRKVPTLVDRFIYPPHGIGQISDRLREEIEKENTVNTHTRVTEIRHKDFSVTGIVAQNCEKFHDVQAEEFISSIPVTHLVNMLSPAPPQSILDAASKLRYRDLVVVTLMLDRERVTDLTWLYLPEKNMPLGRIHEPKNWSPRLAPEKKTSIVAEFFCFRNDTIWNSPDSALADITAHHLEQLGLIRKADVTDQCIIRVPKAYPVFEVGYNTHYSTIVDYLKKFKNLHIAGRTGMFRYYNIDHAIESGRETAKRILN